MRRVLIILALTGWTSLAQRPGAGSIGGSGSSGTVTSLTLAGTTNQITVTGTCTVTTTGTCTFSIPSDFRLPGTINKITLTQPATGATLTIADGKVLTANNSVAFTGTDGSTLTFGAGGTLTYTSNNLSVFAATTSAQLRGVVSDETGGGLAVFNDTPTLIAPILGTPTSGDATNLTNIPACATCVTSAASLTSGAMMTGGGSRASSTPLSPVVTNANSATETATFNNTTATTGVTSVVLVDGAAQSTTNYVHQHQTSAGAIYEGIRAVTWFFGLAGTNGKVVLGDDLISAKNATGCTASTFLGSCTGNTYRAGSMGLSSAGVQLSSDWAVRWAATASGAGDVYGTKDLGLNHDAAGILGVNNGTIGTTAANYRAIRASAHYVAGTTFTLSTNTCSGTSLTGGATAGTFISGTTGTCSGVVTMGNSATTTTGWACRFGDRTSGLATSETASSTTTATFSFATISGEVVSFACMGF